MNSLQYTWLEKGYEVWYMIEQLAFAWSVVSLWFYCNSLLICCPSWFCAVVQAAVSFVFQRKRSSRIRQVFMFLLKFLDSDDVKDTEEWKMLTVVWMLSGIVLGYQQIMLACCCFWTGLLEWGIRDFLQKPRESFQLFIHSLSHHLSM